MDSTIRKWLIGFICGPGRTDIGSERRAGVLRPGLSTREVAGGLPLPRLTLPADAGEFLVPYPLGDRPERRARPAADISDSSNGVRTGEGLPDSPRRTIG
jgi:hypothetical protein